LFISVNVGLPTFSAQEAHYKVKEEGRNNQTMREQETKQTNT